MKMKMSHAAFAATLALLTVGAANQASACSADHVTSCPADVAPLIQFHGDVQLAAPIDVWVCYPYWDNLNGVPGKKGDNNVRWWNVDMHYGKWQKELPPYYSECAHQWVKPGTVLTGNPSCLDGALITTGPMTVQGRVYLMHLPNGQPAPHVAPKS